MGEAQPTSVLDIRVCLLDIIFLCAQIPLQFAVLYFIDRGRATWRNITKFRRDTATEDPSDMWNNKRRRPGAADEIQESNEFMRDKACVRLKEVSKEKVKRKGVCGKETKRVVDNLSFIVNQGEIFGILGKKHSGKSSVLKMIIGKFAPSEGNIWIEGQEVPRQLHKIVRKIGYLPKTDPLVDFMTVSEHLRFFCEIKGIMEECHEQLIEEAVRVMDLSKILGNQVRELSLSDKRRVSVALQILACPLFLFLEEPSLRMEKHARSLTWTTLRRLAVERSLSTVLVSTSSMEEAEMLSTRLAILIKGQAVRMGSMRHIKEGCGEGNELHLKLLPVSVTYVETHRSEIARLTDHERDRLTLEESILALKEFGHHRIIAEMSREGRARDVFLKFENEGFIERDEFISWLYLYTTIERIEQVLKEKFQYKMIGNFHNYYIYELTGKLKLSDIFRFLEQKRETLHIHDYSLKQMSLEKNFEKVISSDQVSDDEIDDN